ncbi:cleavage stimulation factor subunit 2 tau variant isoform X7 [Orcinus orca]|uniref:cleavage stimulation factor subunit 2 tau variant isoform X6 n=1 Tax=Orcinus orca TaxID=9733 RepID=UPI00211233CC|nr:cleavage stimulation factor subunit 2 tau variant isoform X6 [Orcinus orca]XP_049552489.1 cleavage stimulation factor subunit 2 tau variant isoform X7 [Orcinus orca]
MSSLTVRDPAMDRSLRSVFVGNIPYEATEEQLKDIFSEVGSVVSFRLVYDRETGKPKGYGFCEYQDQETALSAMRNLNGREFSGRALRVDNAASEKNKEELKSLGPAAPIIDSPYGDPIDPEDAPESITRAVASLPPEQMFELMKQMKLCVQNSHQEARNMLLQNPQLAYALLQAQVVMRIMDPEIALKILHRKIHVTPLIPGKSQSVSGPGPGLCPGPNVLLNQQNPPAPQPQHLARRPVKDIPPLMQTPIQGGIPAPGPIPAAVAGPGPGPGPLTPGGAMQPQVGMPGVGPVPLERGQVQISDPRAPMSRGPMTAGGLPPRGLLGDAPNDPRGGTLLSVTGEVEPRGYLGPPHQGPPMHHTSGHDSRGPSSHDMRGGPLADPRLLIGEPRGPMIDQRGLPMDGRGSRDSRGMETRAMETEVLETRVMERRGMETCAMEARGMEARGMDARGMEMRGPGPSSRGPMTGGIQGAGPINMGAGGPQGPRQVASISGVGNPGAGMQGAGMQGAGMQGAGMQGAGMQGAGMQGAGMQGAGMQGAGMQGAGMQGAGMQGAGMQGAGMQGAGMQGASIQGTGMQGAGMQGASMQGAGKQGGGQPSSFSPGQSQVTPQDQEKAALIMQVLQLTADQIAMLPPEQRQSILILKEQIQKSTGAS